jgi:hypothetical protein
VPGMPSASAGCVASVATAMHRAAARLHMLSLHTLAGLQERCILRAGAVTIALHRAQHTIAATSSFILGSRLSLKSFNFLEISLWTSTANKLP